MLRKTVKFSEHCYDFVNIRTNNSDYQNIKRKRIANDTSAQESRVWKPLYTFWNNLG